MGEQKVRDFLNSYRMDLTDLDFEEVGSDFLEEMKLGLAGKVSSLQMLPTYIGTEREVPLDEPVLVLDAGGTNFRVATVCFGRDGKVSIENFTKYPMPGVDSEVDKEVFFETMARYVKDDIVEGRKIGFCFSYPVQMFPHKDGRLIQFSKQIKARGVAGELVGENLKLALERIGARKPGPMVILNDTVTTLLAGKADPKNRNCDGFIGFILGTGINCCYLEKNNNISKVTSLDPLKSQVINMESGGFTVGLGGLLDQVFDRTTVDPGRYTLEKMISGRYLGGLCGVVIKKAAEDGLFSGTAAEKLKQLEELTTIAISTYLENSEDAHNPLTAALSDGTAEDRVILTVLIERMVERAAMLAAISLTATVLKSEQGTNPEAPICITAEGTTFHQLKGMKAKTEAYLQKYLTEQHQRYWKLVDIENATLIGAAVAGLTN
ncbi:MAG: hexokinase [Firmicutes bacterium]|nr:hexokinase [Bacillota bacterium]